MQLEVTIKDVISKVYSCPELLKSKVLPNIDQEQAHLGYYSLSSSEDD
jgi:hypothetical protein